LADPENAVFVPQLENPEDLSYFDTERREASMSGVQRDLKAVRTANTCAMTTKVSCESMSSDSTTNSSGKNGSMDTSLFMDGGISPRPAAVAVMRSNDTSSSFGSDDHKGSVTPPMSLMMPQRSPLSGRSISPNTSQDEFFKNFSYQNLPNLSLLTMQKLQSAVTPSSPNAGEDLFPSPPP